MILNTYPITKSEIMSRSLYHFSSSLPVTFIHLAAASEMVHVIFKFSLAIVLHLPRFMFIPIRRESQCDGGDGSLRPPSMCVVASPISPPRSSHQHSRRHGSFPFLLLFVLWGAPFSSEQKCTYMHTCLSWTTQNNSSADFDEEMQFLIFNMT